MNSNLGQLPTEIISSIVQHVDPSDLFACALINQLFYVLCSPLLWRTVNIHKENLATQFLMFLAYGARHPVGQHIRHIDFDYFEWTDDALLLLMEHVALLEELTINNGNNLSDTSLQQLPRYCPHLKKLHLVGCRMTQPSFKALGQYCPQLSRLTIKHCRDLPPDAFTILADAATQYHHACSLERLCLSFGALPGLSLSLEDETAMDLTVLHGLTHLTLCDPPAAILRRIATHSRTCCSSSSWWWWWWPRLISLTIFGCYDLMDSDVIPLLQMCGGDDGGDGLRLEHLRLMNGDLSDATLDAIPAGNRLMTVDVSNNHRITHRAVRRLIIRSPLLTWIDVSSCGGVNMDHFPETAAGQQHYRSEVRDRTRHLYRLYGLYHLDQQDITNIRRSPNNIDSGD